MNATPPEAKPEYSRAPARSKGVFQGQSEHLRLVGTKLPMALLAGGLLGALLLLIAEFTTLYDVRTATSASPIDSVSTGSHHSYALVPVAILAAALAFGVYRDRSRPALLALGLLGVLTLVIALAGDLPDAQASGLIGSSTTHYASASASPGPGLYLETLGAVVLVITCGLGFLLGAPGSSARAGGRSSSAEPQAGG